MADPTALLLAELEAEATPKGTRSSEQWAINNWNTWAARENKPSFELLEKVDATELLKRWFVETTGTNGKELDVDSQRKLYHSFARAIRKEKRWDLKTDPDFSSLQAVGNALVRRRRISQNKVTPTRAAALSSDEEAILEESAAFDNLLL